MQENHTFDLLMIELTPLHTESTPLVYMVILYFDRVLATHIAVAWCKQRLMLLSPLPIFACNLSPCSLSLVACTDVALL
jgi:hypothetical protein